MDRRLGQLACRPGQDLLHQGWRRHLFLASVWQPKTQLFHPEVPIFQKEYHFLLDGHSFRSQRLDGTQELMQLQTAGPQPARGDTVSPGSQAANAGEPEIQNSSVDGRSTANNLQPGAVSDDEPGSHSVRAAADESAPSVSQAREQPASPPVVAPEPVLPSWGGQNQLFGSSRGVEDTENSQSMPTPPADRHSPSPSNGVMDDAKQQGVEDASGNSTESGPVSLDKGKAKAVTVEDEDDEDWFSCLYKRGGRPMTRMYDS